MVIQQPTLTPLSALAGEIQVVLFFVSLIGFLYDLSVSLTVRTYHISVKNFPSSNQVAVIRMGNK
jgi:hypothetical protein